MGLDMYVFKAEAPAIDPNVVHRFEDIKDLGYTLIEEEYFGQDDTVALKEFAVPFNVIYEELDYDRIRKDHNMGEGFHSSVCTGQYTIFRDGKKEVQIDAKTLDEKYKIEVERPIWGLKLTEVAYWRKAYELQNKIYKSFEDDHNILVENCGYYQLSMKQVAMICREDREQCNALVSHENGTLFYHEWY